MVSTVLSAYLPGRHFFRGHVGLIAALPYASLPTDARYAALLVSLHSIFHQPHGTGAAIVPISLPKTGWGV